MRKDSYDASVDRQRLSAILEEMRKIADAFCDSHPVISGQITVMRRSCGKPRCRCASGEPHSTLVLLERRGSEKRVRKIAREEVKQLRWPTARYRTLRRLRRELRALQTEAVRCCDRLFAARLKQSWERGSHA